ncbi:MAG: branched-chain amino acid ABC transporter permease [Bacteroidota bacterium]|nr:branched-chain amino acid ABC transporter permease [Bacteroidota bacterium]MDP4232038.1 branched-chain amino acid ABC transporter permease [Bacteroidota bacterium]MDP4241255.1 branched-chain amino acid ABC transporter permease [Bacteroidota bacterium]MDP4286647.1 branched-chain amino acid ABC transporter permease [Bacteroidota bacterium]
MRSYPALLLAIAVIIGASFLTPMLNTYILGRIMYIGIMISMAVSLNLINGFTGQFSLGHAGFMAIGAYTSAVVTTWASTHGGAIAVGNDPAMFLIALLLGGVLAAVAGLGVGIPSLRLRGDYLAIVTLGFNEIIRVLIQNLDFKIAGVDYIGGARGFSVLPLTTFVWVFITAAIVVFCVENLVNSTYGRGFLAVRDDEVAAEAMGVDTTKFKVRAFVTGAFFAGVGGGLFAHSNYNITPLDFTFLTSIDIVVIVILGGMGSTVGVILAAIILTTLSELLRSVPQYRMIIYSLLLIILMITRPQGLLGPKTMDKLFKRRKKQDLSPIEA